MFKTTRFIFFYAECEKSHLLNKIYHYEIFEYLHRNILRSATCNVINNVHTVIFYFINCRFYLIYFTLCESLCNVSVSTHNCNVINF